MSRLLPHWRDSQQAKKFWARSVLGKHASASALVLHFIWLCFWPAMASAEEYNLTSFHQALRLGLSRNLRLNEAEKRVEEARYALLRTRAVFLPKVQFATGFNQKGAAFTIPAIILRDIPKDPGFFTGYKSEWTTRLQLDQPVFTGGRNLYRYQIAQRDLAIQEEAQRLRRLSLEVEITRGYYGVLLAQRVVEIKQELIAQSKRHQAEVEKRLQAGDASRFEKLRADVQVANLYPELIRARNALDVELAQLKNVLGLQQGDTLSVSGSIEYAPEAVDMQTALRRAGEQRPEIRISQLSWDIAERARKINRARFFPALGAFYTQDFRSNSLDNLYNQRHGNWSVGLALSFPLFEGGSAYYQAREERARTEQAALRKEQTLQDVQVDVIQAALELRRAGEVIESQKQNVAQAEEALRIANISYANGVITNLELMDTQLALDQAKVNYVTAIYDCIVGQAVFRKAVAEHP